jgi:hypothetical protein
MVVVFYPLSLKICFLTSISIHNHDYSPEALKNFIIALELKELLIEFKSNETFLVHRC